MGRNERHRISAHDHGFEVEGFVERLLLKNAGADDLAGHGGKHFVFARSENIYFRNLRFLVKLLGSKLNRLARALVLHFLQRGFQEHLTQ